jgi:hypothetical protein
MVLALHVPQDSVRLNRGHRLRRQLQHCCRLIVFQDCQQHHPAVRKFDRRHKRASLDNSDMGTPRSCVRRTACRRGRLQRRFQSPQLIALIDQGEKNDVKIKWLVNSLRPWPQWGSRGAISSLAAACAPMVCAPSHWPPSHLECVGPYSVELYA